MTTMNIYNNGTITTMTFSEADMAYLKKINFVIPVRNKTGEIIAYKLINKNNY